MEVPLEEMTTSFDMSENDFWRTMHTGAREELIEELVMSILQHCDVTGKEHNEFLSKTEMNLLNNTVSDAFFSFILRVLGGLVHSAHDSSQ